MNYKDFSVQELSAMLRSKQDVYEKLRLHCQLLLPAQRNCSLEFLRLCLRGEKKLLPMREVRIFNFPPLKEFCASELTAQYLEDKDVAQYLPDDIFLPERSFIQTVVGTLKAEEIQVRIDNALKKRGAAAEDDVAEQRIAVLPGIVERLRELHAKPRAHRGRALTLLKEKRRGRPQELARPFLGQKRKASRPLASTTPVKRAKLPAHDEEVIS